eukprot:403356183
MQQVQATAQKVNPTPASAGKQANNNKKSHSQPRQQKQPQQDKKPQQTQPTITPLKKIQDNIIIYANLYKKAENLVRQNEQTYYQKLTKDNKDGDYLLKMLKEGTITDKISALSLLIQKDPIKSLTYLKTLINLSKKKNRKQAESSIGALRDLFTEHGLLKEDSKLLPFSKNPHIMNRKESEIKEKELMEAYFEHQIKELYKEFITTVLQPLTHDDLEHYKKFSLNILQQLIERRPEQEDTILNIIVNKLGDLSKKVQCHTIFVLIKLTQTHKEMAEVIVREVQIFINRTGTKQNHIYYACAYLNRVSSMVAPKDEKVRILLFKIFFSLFKKIVGSEEKKDLEKEKAQIPQKKDRTKSKEQRIRDLKQTEKVGKVDESNNKIAEIVLKGVNVLMLKCQGLDLTSPSNSELRKIIEEETNILFLLTHHSSFKIQIQTLKLLFQFAKSTNKLKSNELQIAKSEDDTTQSSLATYNDRYYRTLYEILLKVHLTKANKLDEFFSLIFKSIKADTNIPRVLAFFRRMLHMCFINETGYTAATLLIISELIKLKDDIKFNLYSFDFSRSTKPSHKTVNVNDSDDEERFYDIDKLQEQKQNNTKLVYAQQTGSNNNGAAYDATKREPKYANADQTPLFELLNLTAHTHPTIKMWADKLINGESIVYAGDPLLDFGLANFLDRISYKNPKSADKLAKLQKAQRMSAHEKPINQYDFTQEQLPASIQQREEEKYMYKYFKEKPAKENKNGEDMSDLDFDEDAEDPELEKYAQQVMEKEMKKMNQGMGEEDLDDEDESILDELDNDEDGEEEDDEEEDGEEQDIGKEYGDEEGDFFEGEELSDVDIKGGDKEEDSEVEMGDDSEEEMDEGDADDYGDEYGEEEEDNLFTKEKSNGKKSKDTKKPKASIYADYDEFATLLEQDVYSEEKAKKYLGDHAGQKRSRSQRGGPRGSSRGGKGGKPGRGGNNKRQRTK